MIISSGGPEGCHYRFVQSSAYCFLPPRRLNFHRRFVPKNPWGLAVRLRIVSLQTFRIAGYIAVIGGIAGLGTLFWIMLHRVNV